MNLLPEICICGHYHEDHCGCEKCDFQDLGTRPCLECSKCKDFIDDEDVVIADLKLARGLSEIPRQES